MSAAWTRMPSNSPSVSTAMCRLRPFSRFAASQPRGPPLSVVFTLWVSMIAAEGLASRPAPSRSRTTKWWRMLSHTPSRRKARIYPYTVRQGGGGRWRQVPPLAAGAHEVEEAVQQVPHVRASRPPSRPGGRDQRFQKPELIVRQCLAGAEIPDQRAISGRPHGGLQAGNRLQRRSKGQDQPLTPAPSPFANGH